MSTSFGLKICQLHEDHSHFFIVMSPVGESSGEADEEDLLELKFCSTRFTEQEQEQMVGQLGKQVAGLIKRPHQNKAALSQQEQKAWEVTYALLERMRAQS